MIRSTIIARIVMALLAIAIGYGLLRIPSPWRPPRPIHGIVVAAEAGTVTVKLVDGREFRCAAGPGALPQIGDVVHVSQELGLFGQTLAIDLMDTDPAVPEPR